MTRLLLATSNGTGMGHLTRQAAVALALGEEHEATLFSLSLGLPLAMELGIDGEYCPSYDRPWIASRNWNSYLRDRLVALVEETGSEAVVFDGVAPYPGIANAAAALRQVAFVWLRRGMWKEANRPALRKGHFFDMVITPGDLASEADAGPTAGLASTEVGPISILEPLGMMPREQARSMLGLPQDRRVALVTLGSGRLGDVVGPGTTAVKALLDMGSDWHVAVTRSPVARNEIPVDQAERLTELRGVYPLAVYLSAFDLAVSSAGYNAVHELIPAGVPTLLVANTSTRTDDQTARARHLEGQNLALAVDDRDIGSLPERIRRLADDGLRQVLAGRAAETMEMMTGASETGARAAAHADRFGLRKRSLRGLAAEQVQSVKETIKAGLGEERTEALKKALGRRPSPVFERQRVRLTDSIAETSGPDSSELAVVRSVTGDQLRSGQPIEHVLAGGSAAYEDRRLEIVDRYYDVVGSAMPRRS